jgi:hypothetical protein
MEPSAREAERKKEINALQVVLNQYLGNTVPFEVAMRAILKVTRFWIIGALLLGLLLGFASGDLGMHHHGPLLR